jgi:hypothetical protein
MSIFHIIEVFYIMLFYYFGYIIPFNIKLVNTSIFQIDKVPYITSLFFYFGYIIHSILNL